MKILRRPLSNKKGINTILAALLMVVIVVVASVMVYAWSTGLLSSLLVQNPVPKEVIQYDSAAYGAGSPTQNLTIYVRNSGSVAVTLQTYYVKDASGNQYTSGSGWTSAAIAPNTASATVICIVSSGSVNGLCPASTPLATNSGSTFSFTAGNSYTVTVVTTRNNQFTWSFTK